MTHTSMKDVLSQSFAVLDPTLKAQEAIQYMRRQNAIYGVVLDAQTVMPALVTIGFLDRAQDQQATVSSLTAKFVRLTPVPLTANLGQLASLLATVFQTNHNLTGLIVIDDQKQVIGVVSRRELAQAANRLIQRGGDTDRLEGEPISIGTYYYCSKHNEKELVIYWEPDNPPRCSKGDLMLPQP